MKTKPVDIQLLLDVNNAFRARHVSRGETRIVAELAVKKLEREIKAGRVRP